MILCERTLDGAEVTIEFISAQELAVCFKPSDCTERFVILTPVGHEALEIYHHPHDYFTGAAA
jgi:hypothetical protein